MIRRLEVCFDYTSRRGHPGPDADLTAMTKPASGLQHRCVTLVHTGPLLLFSLVLVLVIVFYELGAFFCSPLLIAALWCFFLSWHH
jgi:hypothetical protein